MTTERPRLYPGHQHRWAYDAENPDLVRCKVCEFPAPRSLANLDGAMLNDAVYDEADPCPGCGDPISERYQSLGICQNCYGTTDDPAMSDTDTPAPTYRVGNLEFTDPEHARMEEYAQGIGLGAYRPRNPPDTDTRCPFYTSAGQCLDHQGHLGKCQPPQETR